MRGTSKWGGGYRSELEPHLVIIEDKHIRSVRLLKAAWFSDAKDENAFSVKIEIESEGSLSWTISERKKAEALFTLMKVIIANPERKWFISADSSTGLFNFPDATNFDEICEMLRESLVSPSDEPRSSKRLPAPR